MLNEIKEIKEEELSGLLSSVKNNALNTFLVGIDKETGGLNDNYKEEDPNIEGKKNGASHYAIMQIAVIVYNGLFEQVLEPLNVIIYHSKEDLDKRVGEWSKEQFKDTLMLQCQESKITLEMAEEMVLEHLSKLKTNEKSVFYMVGNSIRLDYEFMSAQMKKLKEKLHFRLIDVSTLKTLFTILYGIRITQFSKAGSHDALTDIKESMAELEFYLTNFIRPLSEVIELNKEK